jgi:biofilm PGA synthesis N-glycosyltransferase PgaC
MQSTHPDPGGATAAPAMASPIPRYVVVTPARNEGEHLARAIESMRAQTRRPLMWILVDDGSNDGTAEMIDRAAAQTAWIAAVHRTDRGARQAGGGVVETFYEGYALVRDLEWDFVVKLDADLSFGADYFERCLDRFAQDPALGVAGGTCCTESQPQAAEFANEPAFHVRGPTKIYRRECFEQIGGLVKAPGWDTIDQFKANMLGWRTLTFDDIFLIHHRPTGGAYGSWSNWTKNGLANYISGYDPVFMFCKCLKRAVKQHSVEGLRHSYALWFGFVRGWIRGVPRVDDSRLIAYVRAQQWRSLFLRRSLWKP